MLISEQKVQECDATGDDSSNEAWFIIIFFRVNSCVFVAKKIPVVKTGINELSGSDLSAEAFSVGRHFILHHRHYLLSSSQVCDPASDVWFFCCGEHLPGVFSPVRHAQHSTW
jgi:hypothetical protein